MRVVSVLLPKTGEPPIKHRPPIIGENGETSANQQTPLTVAIPKCDVPANFKSLFIEKINGITVNVVQGLSPPRRSFDAPPPHSFPANRSSCSGHAELVGPKSDPLNGQVRWEESTANADNSDMSISTMGQSQSANGINGPIGGMGPSTSTRSPAMPKDWVLNSFLPESKAAAYIESLVNRR